MILNCQKAVAVDLAAARLFVRRLRRALRLGKRKFNVCFVDDREIERLNVAHRGAPQPTDVLSFPWQGSGKGAVESPDPVDFRDFLGDVVISVPTARRNARREGHSTRAEVRWLILHGVLHLLGYDHETDQGEMTALEFSLRVKLGIDGRRETRRKWWRRGIKRRANHGAKLNGA